MFPFAYIFWPFFLLLKTVHYPPQASSNLCNLKRLFLLDPVLSNNSDCQADRKNSHKQETPVNRGMNSFPSWLIIFRADYPGKFTCAQLGHLRNLLNSVHAYFTGRKCAKLLGRTFCQYFLLHSLTATGTSFLEYLKGDLRIFRDLLGHTSPPWERVPDLTIQGSCLFSNSTWQGRNPVALGEERSKPQRPARF